MCVMYAYTHCTRLIISLNVIDTELTKNKNKLTNNTHTYTHLYTLEQTNTHTQRYFQPISQTNQTLIQNNQTVN